MQNLADYLAMGGYAAFIWPAYGVAAIVLVVFAIDSWRRVKRAAAALQRLEASPSAAGKPGQRDRQAIGS